MEGMPVHGYGRVDGDATTATGTPVVSALNQHGSAAVYNLAATEILYITDLYVSCETGGDIVVAASAVLPAAPASATVFAATVPANFFIHLHFLTPFCCAAGEVLRMEGIATNVDMISYEGFVRRV